MDGFLSLSPADLTSISGVAKLNNMLQSLFQNSVGDGIAVADYSGYGNPNGVLAANNGATYRQIDGTATTSFWIKTTSGVNTGWVSIAASLTVPISTANGGLGADFSAGTTGNILYFSSTGVIGSEPFPSGFVVYNASGTFVAPAGVAVVLLIIQAAGGGAGGAGNNGINNTSGGGGGGGAGAYLPPIPYIVTPGNSYAVTVGAGGAGGVGALPSGSGNNGSPGGDSGFDVITIPGGGAGSTTASNTGGAGGSTSTSSGGGNASGTTGGTSSYVYGQGGTGAAGATGASGNGGGGGGSPFGVGGNGSTSGTGSNGTGFGAGGGGAKGVANNPTFNGGNGSQGFVIVLY